MRHVFAYPILIAAALPLAANEAAAQYNQPPPGWRPADPYGGGHLGGGLIELLATGASPAPRAYNQPGYGAYAAPAGGAPRQGSRRAYAVPPQQPAAYGRPVAS